MTKRTLNTICRQIVLIKASRLVVVFSSAQGFPSGSVTHHSLLHWGHQLLAPYFCRYRGGIAGRGRQRVCSSSLSAAAVGPRRKKWGSFFCTLHRRRQMMAGHSTTLTLFVCRIFVIVLRENNFYLFIFWGYYLFVATSGR